MTNLDKAAALADLLEMAEERLSLIPSDEQAERECAAINGLWEVYASLVEAHHVEAA